MKRIFLLLFIVLSACNGEENKKEQKQAIKKFLQEDAKGVKTDLKIEISNLEISDITVADSIAILENRFQTKIEKAQKSVDNFQKNIESADEENKDLDRNDIDDLAKISANKSISQLHKRGLENAQKQKMSSLKKYEDLDKTDLLVKKAATTFSYFNPRLETRQERTENFVLSKGGTEVLGIIQNEKLRRKKN